MLFTRMLEAACDCVQEICKGAFDSVAWLNYLFHSSAVDVTTSHPTRRFTLRIYLYEVMVFCLQCFRLKYYGRVLLIVSPAEPGV